MPLQNYIFFPIYANITSKNSKLAQEDATSSWLEASTSLLKQMHPYYLEFISNQQSVISNQQSAISNQQSIISNQQSIISNQQSTIKVKVDTPHPSPQIWCLAQIPQPSAMHQGVSAHHIFLHEDRALHDNAQRHSPPYRQLSPFRNHP